MRVNSKLGLVRKKVSLKPDRSGELTRPVVFVRVNALLRRPQCTRQVVTMDLEARVKLEELSGHDVLPLAGVDVPVEVHHFWFKAGDFLNALFSRHGGRKTTRVRKVRV